MAGIAGMSLSPFTPYNKEERKLFFHAFNGGTESWVSTGHLKNRTLFDAPVCFPGQLINSKLFYVSIILWAILHKNFMFVLLYRVVPM